MFATKAQDTTLFRQEAIVSPEVFLTLNPALKDVPIVVYDTETTGFNMNPENPESDRMIQFSGVTYINGKEVDAFEIKINPERDIPESAYKIHKISNADVKNAPVFAKAAPLIMEYLKGKVAFAHNEKFDIRFLNGEFKKANLSETFEDLVLDHYDTLHLSRSFDPVSKTHNLDALHARVERLHPEVSTAVKIPEWKGKRIKNIIFEGRKDRHDALVDAALLGNVLNIMLSTTWKLDNLKDFNAMLKPVELPDVDWASKMEKMQVSPVLAVEQQYRPSSIYKR